MNVQKIILIVILILCGRAGHAQEVVITKERFDNINLNYPGQVFPENKVIEYYATDGASGIQPSYLSSSLPNAGFYAFRNGWNAKATVMQIKAGPAAGSFVYANAGGQENTKRDWYRSTKAHQTLTLDNGNLNNNAKLSKWVTDKNLGILSYTNPSYTNLKHQRTFLFVDQTYFLIIDRAIGTARGNLGIHYVLKEDSKPIFDYDKNSLNTNYVDGNNLLIQLLNKDKVRLKKEKSFVSYQYQKEVTRPALVFEKPKNDNNVQSFVSVLYPSQGNSAPDIKVTENTGHDLSAGKINITININGKVNSIKQDLNL